MPCLQAGVTACCVARQQGSRFASSAAPPVCLCRALGFTHASCTYRFVAVQTWPEITMPSFPDSAAPAGVACVPCGTTSAHTSFAKPERI